MAAPLRIACTLLDTVAYSRTLSRYITRLNMRCTSKMLSRIITRMNSKMICREEVTLLHTVQHTVEGV